MTIEFIKLHEAAKEPVKANEGDFCWDMYAAWVEEIDENYLRYHTGIAVQMKRAPELIEDIPAAWYEEGESPVIIDISRSPIHLSLDARPRSSVWKTGLLLTNCEGTIDEGYTGEIQAVFFRADKSKEPYKAGDRIMQVKIGFTLPIEWKQVSSFEPTKYNNLRGSRGWGSSGINDVKITEDEMKSYHKQAMDVAKECEGCKWNGENSPVCLRRSGSPCKFYEE